MKQAQKDGTDASDTVAGYTALFESLLPPEGVAPLFESETCTLCRTEQKGEASAFAVADYGHEEPKELQSPSLLRRKTPGFLLPVQFACCQKCRLRILTLGYLPTLLTLLCTAPVVVCLADPHIMQRVKAPGMWAPLLLVLLAAGVGYLAGKVLRNVLRPRFAALTYLNPNEHPTVQALVEKGWFPLAEKPDGAYVFTKKRIACGLGTAPSKALRAFDPDEAADEAESEKTAETPKEDAAADDDPFAPLEA